ncbi:TerD family protein [Nocardia aurantiaca]|uniref:Stress protein n=1 Tax=Nocardia aurantiaca TaxID=2675850 RepID=A0A6I3LAD6_9NOCA|nr:TerD family protein [Nocardia aurantiaca]MTE17116.1 stress protein [Nocardia aurantiaca]
MAVQLTKGQIDRLMVDDIVVSVRHSEPVDLSALLLTAAGRVRGLQDLVFYDQPSGPGVRLVPVPLALAIGVRGLPREIEHVRVILAPVDPQARFGDDPPPTVRIADTAGNLLCEYVIEDLDGESAVVAFDLDRAGGIWQIRTLGQGDPAGFGQLVIAHGVPLGGSEDGVYQGLEERQTGRDVSPQDFNKGELSLVMMALGWASMRMHGPRGLQSIPIDMDASALVFAGENLVDLVYYQQLYSRYGGIHHSGDNRTGSGKGDDEVISVDLARLPKHVSAVVFVVTSNISFERVPGAFWRMVDGRTNTELVRGNLRAAGRHTGMVVAKVYRDGSRWRMAVIGAPIDARHPDEAVPAAVGYL